MDKHVNFHPRDLIELAAHQFQPARSRVAGGGKTAVLFFSYADQFDRLNEIRKFLFAARGVSRETGSLEVDLSELAPRRDGPGVPFGALVDHPVRFVPAGEAGGWSCEIPAADGASKCTLRGIGPELQNYDLDGRLVSAEVFAQEDRDFLFQTLFGLNKALEAYCRLNRLFAVQIPEMPILITTPRRIERRRDDESSSS